MVLAQRQERTLIFHTLIRFPSHYGSRSTEEQRQDTNYYNRFHPTMVLAQPGICKSFRNTVRSFHPTMVLAQRMKRLMLLLVV